MADGPLLRQASIAATAQFYAGPGKAVIFALPQPILPQAPLRGYPPIAPQAQFFAGWTQAVIIARPQPILPPLPPTRQIAWSHQIPASIRKVTVVPPPWKPPIMPPLPPVRQPSRAHLTQFYATPAQLAFGYVAGYGSAGLATFVLTMEPGAKVTFTWNTPTFRSYSGLEQRLSPSPLPKRKFEGTGFLLDPQSRDTRSALMRSAQTGGTFLLGLPFEEMILTAPNSGTTIFVDATQIAQCDWAIVTQRVVVIGLDGISTFTGVIQQVGSNFLRLDTASSLAQAGARVLPLVQVLLEAQQNFTRYPVTVDMWSIQADASVFGYVAKDSMGVNAMITTYTVGAPVAISTLVEDDLIIWDRPNAIDGTAAEAIMSGAEIIDLGAMPAGFGAQTVPDWARSIKLVSSSPADWNWLKAFLRLLRGSQRPFLLPTNRSDLFYVSGVPGNVFKVQSSAVTGAGDYTAFYQSLAHRRLVLTFASGAVQYVTVNSTPVNNGDGTLTLTFDATVTTTPVMISFAEQVRLDGNGDIAATWDGGVFEINLTARTCQDVTNPPSLFMYDTVINASFIYGGGSAPGDQELIIAAGPVTYVRVSSDRSALTFGGISVTSAGGNQDGMVVTVTTGAGMTLALIHEDVSFTAGDRMWLPARSNQIALNESYTFVYSSAAQRWICIWGNQI